MIELLSYGESWPKCRTILLVCVLLSAIICSLLVLHMQSSVLEGDEPIYDSVARNVLSGKGFWYGDYWLSEKSPGYSVFLAGVYAVTGGSETAARAVQGAIHLFTVALTVMLAYRLTQRKAVAWIAGILAASDLYVTMFHLRILSESIFDPISFGMLLAFDSALRDNKSRSWILTGLLFGLSVLIRPSLYLLPVFLLAVGLIVRVPVKRIAVGLVIAGVVTTVVLLPWSVRNYNIWRVVTPLPAYGGTCLNLQVKNAIRTANGEPTQNWHFSLAMDRVYRLSEGQTQEALRLIVQHPGVFAVSIPYKSLQLWTTSEWGRMGSNPQSVLLGVVRLTFLALAVFALFLRRLDRQFRLIAIAAVGYITLLTAVSANPEYRYAFWTYPAYYVLIAFAAEHIARKVWFVHKEKASK